jgi:hypothetical protein
VFAQHTDRGEVETAKKLEYPCGIPEEHCCQEERCNVWKERKNKEKTKNTEEN